MKKYHLPRRVLQILCDGSRAGCCMVGFKRYTMNIKVDHFDPGANGEWGEGEMLEALHNQI